MDDMREPYTYEVVETAFLGFPKCNIIFDETVIREITLPLDAVKEIVSVLNSAYQVGYMEGKAELHG